MKTRTVCLGLFLVVWLAVGAGYLRGHFRDQSDAERLADFVATVRHLESLQCPDDPDTPPIAPTHGPGERDPYARYKSYARVWRGGASFCANCATRQPASDNSYCPECGTHLGGFEIRESE